MRKKYINNICRKLLLGDDEPSQRSLPGFPPNFHIIYLLNSYFFNRQSFRLTILIFYLIFFFHVNDKENIINK